MKYIIALAVSISFILLTTISSVYILSLNQRITKLEQLQTESDIAYHELESNVFELYQQQQKGEN